MRSRRAQSRIRSEREAKEIWHQGWDYVNADKRDHRADFVAYVREKIAVLNAKPESTVKNRVGFLIQAIREGYTDPHALTEATIQQQRDVSQKIRRLSKSKEQAIQKWQEAEHRICEKAIAEDP